MPSHLEKPESFLQKLSKKGLLVLSKALYFDGIDDFSKEDIIGIILEIYEVYNIDDKHMVFIDKAEKNAIVFDITTVAWISLAIPVLDIHKYNKVIFDNGNILVKKNKKIYVISKEITLLK